MKDLTAVKRYTHIVRKPFTTLDFIEDTGFPKARAIRILNVAARLAILNYLGGTGAERTYVPVPPKTPKYFDFTPCRTKLAATQALLSSARYRHWEQIIAKSGMGKRTLQRYLNMLEHLGCATMKPAPSRNGSPKKTYKSTGKAIPERIPPYYRTLSPAWKIS